MHQTLQKPLQQLLQIPGLQLDTEQFVERLSFGLPDLVIRVIERQDDAEMELFPHPLEVRVLFRHQRA